MKLIRLIVFFVLLISSPAFAATYYIDYVGGEDTNNGTATETPFKHCPGDDSATDTVASTTLSAGDTVIFKGGVAYLGRIDLDWSGSSGSVITYDGNSAGTWGTGKAIIDGEAVDTDARRYGFYASTSRNYITIYNFDIRHMGGDSVRTSCDSTATSYGAGIIFNAGGNGITVKDCVVWDIGDWENKEYADQAYMTGAGILFKGSSSGIVVDNVEIYQNAQYGIAFITWAGIGLEITDVEVKNCDVHGAIRWGIYLGTNGSSSSINDVEIHDNKLRDITIGEWIGCAGAYTHIDPLMMSTNISGSTSALGTAEKPIKIYNNFIYSDFSGTSSRTAEMFFTAWGGTLWIYNNLFVNHKASTGAALLFQGMSSGDAADFHIYNNTFYGAYRDIYVRNLGGIDFATADALDISNNIFYHIQTSASLPPILQSGGDGATITKVAGNVFYTTQASNLIYGYYPSGTLSVLSVANLNNLGIASGTDNKIVAAGSVFTDISYGLGVSSSLNDLTLKAGSTAIDVGADLFAYFTIDRLGNTRSGTWDAGAYESGASGDTTPPTALSATIPAAGTTLVVGFSEPITATAEAAFTTTLTGGAVTVTCPAVETAATTITCTLSRTVEQSETGTYSYSGTEVADVATNQLAAISGAAVTNSSEQQAPTYTLTVTPGDNVDSYTLSPSGGTYDSGTVVTVQTLCNTGYVSPSYTGDCASDGTVTVADANKSCGVSCSQGSTLTVSPGAHGEVVTSDVGDIDCHSGEGATCSDTYYTGMSVTLTCYASGRYNCTIVGDGCSGGACSMTEDRTVQVLSCSAPGCVQIVGSGQINITPSPTATVTITAE